MNYPLLGRQVRHWNNFALAHYLAHGHACKGQIGKILKYCTTTCLFNPTDLQWRKCFRQFTRYAFWFILIIPQNLKLTKSVQWFQRYVPIWGKYTRFCTTASHKITIELRTEKMHPKVSDSLPGLWTSSYGSNGKWGASPYVSNHYMMLPLSSSRDNSIELRTEKIRSTVSETRVLVFGQAHMG